MFFDNTPHSAPGKNVSNKKSHVVHIKYKLHSMKNKTLSIQIIDMWSVELGVFRVYNNKYIISTTTLEDKNE